MSRSIQTQLPVYLDCNATAPLEPAVRDAVVSWLTHELGNPASRTHQYGVAARKAVQAAREQIATVVDAAADEVLLTSGATESNNLAILGLQAYGERVGRRHIISTAIEHKAVLEPLQILVKRGFEVTLVRPEPSGAVTAEAVAAALRPDTLLVSVMHVNSETGVKQPLLEIANALAGHDAYFHVDAAQGFGKELASLRTKRIDLISVSSHKIYGPAGVGALITRRRNYTRPPLEPLAYGGGHERGLRPGTVPVPLVVGFGLAAELAQKQSGIRQSRCAALRAQALAALEPLNVRLHGDPDKTLPHVLNFSVPGVDSEALIVALKDLVAISNGSACTSQNYTPSHVLSAMSLPPDAISGAIRMSWCHLTPDVDWLRVAERIASLL